LSKALLRLSGACELHPTCFTLAGLEEVGPQVAGGGFGDICKGLVGGQNVAVKSMRRFRDDDVKIAIKKFGREALIWRQLSHPNLLPFFGIYTYESRLCLVSPWMDNGDLTEVLNKASSDMDRVSLIVDVAMGLEYLHSQHVVHGDLKAANILVTPSGRACIADFGLASVVDVLSFTFTHTSNSRRPGTVRYQAPELLSNQRPNHFGSDVYAFACLCYEARQKILAVFILRNSLLGQILTGRVPFFEIRSDAAVLFKVVIQGGHPTRLEIISPADLWFLLENCWKQNPDERPTMAAIFQRLVNQPIGAQIKQSPSDWDEAYSARFRRSVQDQPL
ncbi:kinase-like domain-containing protein, partial [Mycena leptocephala]